MLKVSKTSFYIMFISVCVALLTFTMKPVGLTKVLNLNYNIDIICALFSVMCFIVVCSSDKMGVFSPIVLFSTVYIFMFFITPIYDIANGKTVVFGVTDLFDYGIKGSLYALVGYVIFMVVYKFNVGKKVTSGRWIKNDEPAVTGNNLALLAIFLWSIAFLLDTYLTITLKDYSLMYYLTLGFSGSNTTTYEYSNSLLGFIQQLTRSMIPFYLVYFNYGKNRLVKYVAFFLTFVAFSISGFRYLAVVFIISVFFSYYLINGKKPKKITIVSIIALLIIIVGVIGFIRGTMRSGAGASLNGLDFADITDAIMGNFSIYKSYYSVIKAVPKHTPYIYFDQMFVYTLILLVPRIIWPGKPGNPGTKAQLYGLNETAVKSGYAYPCLGEYYYSFGVVGIILSMGLFGWWLAHIKLKYYEHAKTPIDYMIYSVAISSVFQLIIRGYTPTNFYFLVVLILPLVLLKKIERRK